MNRVCLSGNLTRDLDVRETNSGKKVANFTLAINMGKDKTEFVSCVAWEKAAEILSKYCKKGDKIAVDGRLQTTKYTVDDGSDRYKTEVVVDGFDLPGRNGVSEDAPIAQHNKAKADGYVKEDEIPF